MHQPTKTTKLQEYEEFRDYLYVLGSEVMSDEELRNLYQHDVVITYQDRRVTIPFDAVVYNSLVQLIETQIKEY